MRTETGWIVVAGLLSAAGMTRAETFRYDLPKSEYNSRQSVSDPATWKPVPDQVAVPTGGVTVADAGLFKPVMENNIGYLLKSFSVNHMLAPFRQRAGITNPPDDRAQVGFWETKLRGACAGRFMMGAGNTLRWIEHPELRKRLNELIDGIENCRGTNGYILAYPCEQPLSEEPNYARAWFTHGLIEAAIAGNPKAYGLLRGHADWFNHWDLLPKLLHWQTNSHQGHIASTRTYFSPIGKPEDLQVAEKYYVCDWWMDELIKRHPDIVWKYPLDRPHSYEITSFEAYLDHYRATGDEKYLDAMLGAWDLIHDNWLYAGGNLALCEHEKYPPKSYYLSPKMHTGELCGSVFWIKFNQRFHQLYPEQEKYTAEIEKSLYNVGLQSQAGTGGVHYHNAMQEKKYDVRCYNSCCEGQGTRLYGSLPEYVYSIAKDGVYVNLYEPSSIRCSVFGKPVTLALDSRFPFQPHVALRLAILEPIRMNLRIRIPSWACEDVPLTLNGKPIATGKPGTYASIERVWNDGDTVRFTVPMGFRITHYEGADQIAGHERYAIEYGPLLMAVTGPLDNDFAVTIPQALQDVQKWLTPRKDQPLCFDIAGDAQHVYMPYLLVKNQSFCTYPVIGPHTVTRQ